MVRGEFAPYNDLLLALGVTLVARDGEYASRPK